MRDGLLILVFVASAPILLPFSFARGVADGVWFDRRREDNLAWGARRDGARFHVDYVSRDRGVDFDLDSVVAARRGCYDEHWNGFDNTTTYDVVEIDLRDGGHLCVVAAQPALTELCEALTAAGHLPRGPGRVRSGVGFVVGGITVVAWLLTTGGAVALHLRFGWYAWAVPMVVALLVVLVSERRERRRSG